jgi:hypothetical protein
MEVNMPEQTLTPPSNSAPANSYVTTAYTELCRSYQGLHDFRMKLLGVLPIASIVGLLALGRSAPPSSQTLINPETIGYIGVFSALFTLALFGYEIRGLLMCHDFYVAGAALESVMKVEGQFTSCNEHRNLSCYDGGFKRSFARMINDRVTSCAVYSLAFAAWFFVGLRYAFNVHPHKCVYWAASLGILLAIVTSVLLHTLTAQPQKKGSVAPGELTNSPATG